eukprot:comp11933_c0_seq1/m.6600 comp11933_c0_seq1/g.6600  ORF comp11933_c0_seq1/g.6600 comp11933_c0_seq1/m.6600 type:complete len:478 (-) comp11933_c0_seq1:163-1596(-)
MMGAPSKYHGYDPLAKGRLPSNPFDVKSGTLKGHETELELKVKTFSKCVVLCCLWYFFGACSNNMGKSVMKDLPYPQTVTFVQLGSVAFYLPFAMKILGVKMQSVSRQQFLTLILPLAIGRVFGSFTASISIWKVPVSYAHTVKAISPVCTVILSWGILGERPTLPLILSLLPIVLGVMLATVTEIFFDWTGLICALLSTVIFSVQNIYSKKVMRQHVLDHLNLLFHTTRTSLAIFLPFWLLTDGRSLFFSTWEETITTSDLTFNWLAFKLWFCGFSHFGQNITAFSVLFLVSPVSYSVANTTKRIVIISTSLLVFGNPVTFWNVVGMSMAVGGVAFYNKAKYDAAKKKSEMMLPVARKDSVETAKSPFIEYGDDKVLEAADHALRITPHSSINEWGQNNNNNNGYPMQPEGFQYRTQEGMYRPQSPVPAGGWNTAPVPSNMAYPPPPQDTQYPPNMNTHQHPQNNMGYGNGPIRPV